MIFANQTLAFAALATALIPILLHFFFRRPQATPWGSNYLLLLAISKFQRRHRIEKWLLLLLRTLTVVLVGLATASPFTRSLLENEKTTDRWIILDDGATSAELRPGGKSVLEESKQKIVESLKDQDSGQRTALVLGSTPARLFMEPTKNHDAVIRAIASVETKETPTDIPSALELAFPKIENTSNERQVELWSGFRRGSLSLDNPLPGSLVNRSDRVTLIAANPLEDHPHNDAIWGGSAVRTAGELEDSSKKSIRLQFKREGSNPDSTNQILLLNTRNELLAKKDLIWEQADRIRDLDIQFQSEKGVQGGIHATIQDDAQPLDNKAYFSLDTPDNPKVTILGRRSFDQDGEHLSSSNWIFRAIESTGSSVQEMDAETISIRPPMDTDTVILTRPDLVDQAGWAWLRNFSADGGVLVITPAEGLVEQHWGSDIERILQTPIRTQKETREGVFRLAAKQPHEGPLALLGAELDVLCEPIHVSKHLPIETTNATAHNALLFESGEPMLCWSRPSNGRGVVAILSVSPNLDWSDLPVKPLMVPLFQELVRGGRLIANEQQAIQTGSRPSFGSHAAGGLLIPPPQSNASTIELDHSGQSPKHLLVPGLWTLQKDGHSTKLFAANLHPSAASIQPTPRESLQSWFATVKPIQFMSEIQQKKNKDSTNSFEENTSGTLFLLALGCALLESLLSRKNSSAPTQHTMAAGA